MSSDDRSPETISMPPRTESDTLDEPAAPGELPPGTTLGRYVLRARVGAGAMGVVYAAHDVALQRDVAVKLVRPDIEPSRARRRSERLRVEAQLLAKLTHPNVIVVHDVGVLRDQVFVAMQWLGGGTLRAWVDCDKGPTVGEVLRHYAEVAEGLAVVHGQASWTATSSRTT